MLFDSGTLVKNTEDVSIAQYNGVRIQTHLGRLKNLEAAFKHRYKGQLIDVVPHYLPGFRCTPNHKVLTTDDPALSPQMMEARHLTNRHYLAIPKSRQDDKVYTQMDLLKAFQSAAFGPRNITDQIKFKAVSRLNEKLSWLLGVFCAKGRVIPSKIELGSVLVFTFGKHEKGIIRDTCSVIKEVFREDPEILDQGCATHLYVYNSILALAIKKLAGGDSQNKRVPNSILFSDDQGVLRTFLSGYLAGNGCGSLLAVQQEDAVNLAPVPTQLVLGVIYCTMRMGSAHQIYQMNSTGTFTVMDNLPDESKDHLMQMCLRSCNFGTDDNDWSQIENLIKQTEAFILIPVKKVEIIEHDGYVYNLQVAEDHTYCTPFFAASNCQNYDISQRRKVEGVEISPEDVPRLALAQGCHGIAYTYNEPTIFIEFAKDIGLEARKKGLFNIFVSNGYATPQSVSLMSSFLDCITVDFKGNGEKEFVRKYIGIPDSDPIFQTLLQMKKETNIHIEITDLVVPGVGDNLDVARKMCKWVFDNLGPMTPVHFLRFHPDYKMMEFPATPIDTLEAHHRVAKEEGLQYVYLGNVAGHKLEHTYCHGCNQIVVRRYGFDIMEWNLDLMNRCKYCGTKIPIEGGLGSSVSEPRYLPAYF